MEGNERTASRRQMAYIRRLRLEMGEQEPEISGELSGAEASALISELLSKAGQNGRPAAQKRINEPRLGMAMKECFRVWRSLGRDVFQQHRQMFIDEVIETYQLFTEIAGRLEGEMRGSSQTVAQAGLVLEQAPEVPTAAI